EKVDRLPQERGDVDDLRLRSRVAHRRQEIVEPHLKNLGVPQDGFDPLKILVGGGDVQLEHLGAAADHRQGRADLMDDSGENTANLDELLVQHRHAGHLAKLNQAAHPAQNNRAGRILGDVVVSPCFQASQYVRVVVANREHQDGQAGDLPVIADSAADLQAVHVGKVHVQND